MGKPSSDVVVMSSSSPAKLREATPMFGSDFRYFIGSWRRAPFDPAADAQCLAANARTSVCLQGFEADDNLWSVVRLENGSCVLKCAEIAKVPYLGPDLNLKASVDEAALWEAVTYPAFRGGEYDVSVQFTNSNGQFLCANEKTRQVAILSSEESEQLDADGQFIWNIAWECTPDLDDDAEDHITSYLERTEL